MAKLTEQLGAVNSGKPIVDPGAANPSPLEPLANIGNNLVQGVSDAFNLSERRAARAREEEDRARRLANEGALDEVVGGVFNIRREAAQGVSTDAPEAPMPDWLGGSDSSFTVPPGVMARADELLRARRAVEQGRASQASLDMRIENFVSEMFAKHPDSRYEIATAMRGLGIEHYMFRAEQQEREFAEAGSDAQTQAAQTQFKYAADRGLITHETPFIEGARRGRQAMEDQARIDAVKARVEAARADRTLSLQERTELERNSAAETSSALMSQVATAIGPVIENTTLALSAAGTDAERQTILGESRIRANAALVAYENRAVQEVLASGGTVEDVDRIKDFVKSQRDSLDALYSGSFEQNSVAMRNITATFNMTAAQAAPMYSRAVSLLGQPAANALFGDATGIVNLDPRIVAQVRGELLNVDPTTERGTVSLARAIGYMRGQTGLQDLRPDEAVAYIQANAVALRANTTALVGGNTTVLRPWAATYGNMAEAVVELAPSTTSISSLHSATNQVASGEARRALEIARREDPEYGAALTQASRAAAANALMLAGGLPDPRARGWTMNYDEQAGVYRPQLTRQAYEEQRRIYTAQSSGSRYSLGLDAYPSYERELANVPTSVTQRATTLTRALTHLVQTDQYDEAIPRTLTIRERRDLYAQGRTPQSLRQTNAEGGAAPTQASEWETIRGNLDTSIQNLITSTVAAPTPAQRAATAPPMDELQATVRDRGERMGLPWALVNRVVAKESTWDPRAENRSTQARGLFQINDDNSNRSLDANINDGLSLLKEAQEGAQRVLGRIPSDWETYVMHQQGPGGGAALLNPANASLNVVDVLTPLYPNRRIATQAVVNNGGNTSMTASEFAQSIKAYYERN